MSRCFPFPPPGYEKKDADLLNKEKQREKKPKKEKKDKEKREDKGKKEKDRSDGKHRDRKEKDKDKKKEKEKEKEKKRNKDKEKKTPLEDKRLVVQSDSNNKDKLNEKCSDGDKDKDRNSISDEKRRVLQFYGHSGDMPIHNSLFPEGTGEFKFVQELCRRIRDEEEGTGSQLVDRFPIIERENVVRDRVVLKDARNLAGWKERNNENGVDSKKISGVDARFNGSAMVQNLGGLVQNRVEVLPRALEKQFEQRVEEKEKLKKKEGGDKGGEKCKDKDKEKKSHGKDKERDKEKKKAEKVKEKSESKTKDGGKLQDSKKNDPIGTLNVVSTNGAKDGDRNSATEGILKKRKDLEVNGFLHATEGLPHKLPRPSPNPLMDNGRKLEPCHTAIPLTSAGTEVGPIKLPRPSPYPSVENGKKLETCQNPILLTSDRQGVSPSNLKFNNKEIKVNGVIESQPLPISSKRSPSPSTKAEKNVEASTKSLHPDSKYLSKVLSVPKMEDWSDFDDQEWLFSSKNCLAEKIFSSKDCLAEKKPKVESAESPRVWAEALQIESADICALPYVIPY